jgi:hypothetical protein
MLVNIKFLNQKILFSPKFGSISASKNTKILIIAKGSNRKAIEKKTGKK